MKPLAKGQQQGGQHEHLQTRVHGHLQEQRHAQQFEGKDHALDEIGVV